MSFEEVDEAECYERCSDIDDLILNITGVIIGSAIYRGIRIIKTKIDICQKR